VFYKRGSLIAELERAGIPIVDLRKRGRWEVQPFVRRTRELLRETQPDVLYSFLGGANIVAATVRSASPRTRLVWSLRASRVDFARYDWTHRLGYWVERFLSFVPDLIIANSSAGRQFAIEHGFPAGRTEVVPNGIDAARFRPDPELRRAQRRHWHLAEDEIAVGVLARLDPMKDHPTFLRAAAIAARQQPDLRFLCIGEGPEEMPLRRLATELGLRDRVTFTGPADAVSALNALDIACSSSITEGFPNAIAEAMACGLPCVVTDVGDSARIVGDAGIVVPPSDPEALAARINELVARPGDERVRQARRHIIENFSVDLMVERTCALLSRTVAGLASV
jgi:glycosyltransferase involved in cell wall biosynthesis